MNPPATPALPPLDVARGLAQVRAHLAVRLKRSGIFMTVLCLAIAALFTALDGGRGPHYKLLYSFCIGLSCWCVIEGPRLVAMVLADRARARRGEPPKGDLVFGWRSVALLMLLGMVGGPIVGTALADAITGFHTPSPFNMASTGSRLTLTVTVIASLTTLFVLTTLERLANARSQAQTAQREAAENQLKLLESQLEPHMLFNTLANLRVLIGSDPARAKAMLDHLIAFLRATLNASRVGLHPLAAEFERLGDYLALMAVRMGPRLQFVLDLPADLRGLPVPPLLLQPLLENSIKHGLEPQVQGGRIELRAAREGPLLVLTVHDTGVGLSAAASAAGATGGTRFGLEQVRSRLHTLYGSAATLTLSPASGGDGGTLARITLPLEAP